VLGRVGSRSLFGRPRLGSFKRAVFLTLLVRVSFLIVLEMAQFWRSVS